MKDFERAADLTSSRAFLDKFPTAMRRACVLSAALLAAACPAGAFVQPPRAASATSARFASTNGANGEDSSAAAPSGVGDVSASDPYSFVVRKWITMSVKAIANLNYAHMICMFFDNYSRPG